MKASIAGVILIVSLIHLGVCCSDDDISELKEQISLLGAKLDQLKCQSSPGDNQEPTALPEEEDQSPETEQSTQMTRQTESPLQNLPMTIIEVKKEAVGEGTKFSVKYGSNETTIITRWEFALGRIDEGTDTALGNGEYETSVLVPASEVPHLTEEDKIFGLFYLATVHLYTDNYGEGVSMQLYNGKEDVHVLREIPVPFFEVNPAGDLVYEEGEDVFFNVHKPSRIRGFMTFMTYLNPDTGDVVRDYAENYIDFTDGHDNGFTVQIDTSESGISGLFTMESGDIVDLYNPEVNTVFRTYLNYIKEVTVRPASQSGPFPDGYLGFVKTAPGFARIKSGHNITECRVGQTCKMGCIVAGSDITQMTVEKLGNMGAFETLDQEKYDIEEITKPYLKEMVVRFREDSMPDESDILRCTAQNAEGKTIVMETTVMVIIPVDVIEEESGIKILEDQDGEDMKIFKIFCTVRGDPQPKVNLTIYSSADNHGSSFDDEINDIGNNTSTSVKYASYSVEDFEDSSFYLYAHCEASIEEPFWDSVDHFMRFW